MSERLPNGRADAADRSRPDLYGLLLLTLAAAFFAAGCAIAVLWVPA